MLDSEIIVNAKVKKIAEKKRDRWWATYNAALHGIISAGPHTTDSAIEGATTFANRTHGVNWHPED